MWERTVAIGFSLEVKLFSEVSAGVGVCADSASGFGVVLKRKQE